MGLPAGGGRVLVRSLIYIALKISIQRSRIHCLWIRSRTLHFHDYGVDTNICVPLGKDNDFNTSQINRRVVKTIQSSGNIADNIEHDHETSIAENDL